MRPKDLRYVENTQVIPHPQIPCAQGGLLCGVIPAGMCKSALPKVEGEAIGGVQWIDLDKIYPSVSLEAKQTPRDFYFAILQPLVPRPVCALKDKRTLTVGGGKNIGR